MLSTVGSSLDYADINSSQNYNGPMPESSRSGPIISGIGYSVQLENQNQNQYYQGQNQEQNQGNNYYQENYGQYNNNQGQNQSHGQPYYENNQNQRAEDHVNISNVGLRDKIDQGQGLIRTNVQEVQTTTAEYTFTIDTRDCIGQQSLEDAQYIARTKGIRPAASGIVITTSGPATIPMIITVNNIDSLRNGDYITIVGVQGNTNADGKFYIDNVTPTTGNQGTFTINKNANNSYYSGGEWTRSSDPGYPSINDTSSIIVDNLLIANIPMPLRELRTMSLYNIVIPRDIIPLEAYLSDFVKVSTEYNDIVYPGSVETNYETFIKEEPIYTKARMIGFFSSPLDLWRSYIDGNMSLPDSVTPSPLELWNPPGPGIWPNQPIPYPFQTVPTYRSGDFTVPGQDGLFRVILAGYGVVDLLDWTYTAGLPEVNALITSIMRKLLLILICPKQSYRNIDYVSLILESPTVTPGNLVYPFGYGVFQRMLCANGLAMNYNPGTNLLNPGNPTISTVDSPIPFPNFRGNVWGPYSGPGSRFQSLGTRTCIQDLFLNGDLNNLHGSPIIFDNVPIEGIPNHPTYGLNFLSLIEVNLGNIQTSTNPNIINAMRIVSNGFGTSVVRANGGGATYINKYTINSGGQGPSPSNQPSTWSDQSLYPPGTGSLSDPIAKGPNNPDLGPDLASATTDVNTITKLTSYYDLGPNNGQLITNILKYIEYAVNDIPDNDLIIQCEELSSERGIRSFSTNNVNGPALIDSSIRLSIGSANGTQQYIESIQSLVSMCDGFWTTRYMAQKAKIEKLHLRFYTYDQIPIPLEKMLQPRRTNNLLLLLNKLSERLQITPFNISYLFNELDPKLIGRMKRYFQLVMKIVCYEKNAPGLAPESYIGFPPNVSNTFQGVSYN